MFTGLIEGTAQVLRWESGSADGSVLWLGQLPFALPELELGESIAVNGCCLSVSRFGEGKEAGEIAFDLLHETREVTALGDLEVGDPVNLERALAVGARLGGHFVQGHVDSTVKIIAFAELDGGDWELCVALDPVDLAQVLPRGSIALDGISLTAARLDDDSAQLSCFIIPHTRKHTRLRALSAGDRLNVEFDLLGKFVRRAAQLGRQDRD